MVHREVEVALRSGIRMEGTELPPGGELGDDGGSALTLGADDPSDENDELGMKQEMGHLL